MNDNVFSAVSPFDNFEEASRAVLQHLHQLLGFDLWMMTRTEGEDWIVLQTEDHGYSVEEGTVLKWADSFCSRMVKGFGPRMAPCSDQVDVYANAPIGQQVPIKAYVGVPVNRKDGSLFGTLCAIDPNPQSDDIVQYLPVVELMAQLLGTILESDLLMLSQERKIERFRHQAVIDTLTNLYNRRGWEQNVQLEEQRAKRYGKSLSVVIIDLNDLKMINDTHGHARGDELIINTASSLLSVTRSDDIVARLGGDEFGVIAVGCNQQGLDKLLSSIREKLLSNSINASVGAAVRDSLEGIDQAIEKADYLMYQDKKAHTQSKISAQG